MPPRNARQRVEKERGGGGAESGCSVWPLQRSEQDVWTLHKHHWSLNPPLPPCQTGPAVLAKTKYMDVCVPVSLPISAHQQTSIYRWEDPAGLVCQCLWTAMFDDVSPCVYINETEMYALICPCARMSAYVYLCVCAHVTGGGWRKVPCGKTSPAQSRCSLNRCGCQRKLWSEESANRAWGMSPETRIIWNPRNHSRQASQCPYIKVPPGPGCVSPSHRGPPISWAPSVCVPSCTMGYLIALDALLMPVLSVWAHFTTASPGRAIMQSEEPAFMLHIYSNLLAGAPGYM